MSYSANYGEERLKGENLVEKNDFISPSVRGRGIAGEEIGDQDVAGV
jgi:hypothetical protein